eukprot:scaffold6580_cov29-Tisochrysis_lutea.AAC.7
MRSYRLAHSSPPCGERVSNTLSAVLAPSDTYPPILRPPSCAKILAAPLSLAHRTHTTCHLTAADPSSLLGRFVPQR